MGLLDIVKDAGKGLSNVLTGGLVGEIVDVIDRAIPDKMGEKEKADVEIAVMQVTHKREIDLLDKWNQFSQQFQKFVTEHEGSAADLIQLGLLGKILLGLRGIQRPVWGFGTLYLDFLVISKLISANGVALFAAAGVAGTLMMYLLISVNLIVLTFLFGERAVKNVMPLIENAIRAYKGTDAPRSTNAIG